MTLRPYSKGALSFQQQVDLLRSRGLGIGDEQRAVRVLERTSYYRLSAYWLPFKQPNDSFESGATFEEAERLYEFDRRLRLLVLDALERVEVRLRTQITYSLAHAYGPFAHEEPANFHAGFDHPRWVTKLHDETGRSHETFVNHFMNSYCGFPKLPIWMAAEVMTLGALFMLFRAMQPNDRRPIAARYGVHYDVLASWLHALTYVRNVCAHHSRLWNRELAIQPRLPNKESLWKPPHVTNNRRLYAILLILRTLTRDHHFADDWAKAAIGMLHEISRSNRWRSNMGIPVRWDSHPLWRV